MRGRARSSFRGWCHRRVSRTCRCGGCWCGDPSPAPLRALLRAGLSRCGDGTRAPGGGRLLPWCWASGVERSPMPDDPSLEHAAGPSYPLAEGAGGVGLGTRHQPHCVPSCELALRASGAALGLLGGCACCVGVGRPGSGALPRPNSRQWGVRPGPATHWPWVRGMWAWGPVTIPTARAVVSWLCALWGRHEGAPGGGASSLGVWCLRLGALPRPTARPPGVRQGYTTHWLVQAETEPQPRTPQTADNRGTTPQTVPKHTHPRPKPGLAGLTKPTPNRKPDPNTNAAQQ